MRWFVALVTAACLWAAGGTPRDALQLRDRQAAQVGHAPASTPVAHARKAPPHSRARLGDPFVFVGAPPASAPAAVAAPITPPVRAGLVSLAAPSPVSRGPPCA
ncbi:MAG TPA: hypothetical protein VLT45_05390 [Kofleriaceae bacterium]|nr:hypothetical protein [Kofleriaceae bacterium]